MGDPSDPRNSRIIVSDFLAMFRPKYDDATPLYELECKKYMEKKIDSLKSILLDFSDASCRLAAGKAVEILNNYFAGNECRVRESMPQYFVNPSREEAMAWINFFDSVSYDELLDYGTFLSSYGWEKVSHYLLSSFNKRRFEEVFYDDRYNDWIDRANKRVHLFNGQYLPLNMDPSTFRNISIKPGTHIERWALPSSFFKFEPKTLRGHNSLETIIRIHPPTKNLSAVMKKTFDHFNHHVDVLLSLLEKIDAKPEEYKYLSRVYFDGVSITGREKFFRRAPEGLKFERMSEETRTFWINLIMGSFERSTEIGQTNVAAGWGYLQRDFAEFFVDLKKPFYLDHGEIIEDPLVWLTNARGKEESFKDTTPYGIPPEEFKDLQDRASAIMNFAKPRMNS